MHLIRSIFIFRTFYRLCGLYFGFILMCMFTMFITLYTRKKVGWFASCLANLDGSMLSFHESTDHVWRLNIFIAYCFNTLNTFLLCLYVCSFYMFIDVGMYIFYISAQSWCNPEINPCVWGLVNKDLILNQSNWRLCCCKQHMQTAVCFNKR